MKNGPLAVPDGDLVIPEINRIQEQFDLVLATQDWHPPGHKSFASAHPGTELLETVFVNGLEQVLWPDHCIQCTEGAQLSRSLDQHRVEAIFRKGTDAEIDSYSGFYDNGHRKSTGLADYLKGRGIDHVFVAGLAADYCVYFTVMDALALGFHAHLIENATVPINEAEFQSRKAEILARGGKITHR